MLRFRPFCALLTAFAVFVVSNTCSPAACLLPMGVVHREQPSAPVESCCGDMPSPASQGHHDAPAKDHRCPMCQGAVVTGQNVEQGHGPDLKGLTPCFFVPLPASCVLTSRPSPIHVSVVDPSPPHCNSLLEQHCALLN